MYKGERGEEVKCKIDGVGEKSITPFQFRSKKRIVALFSRTG